MTAQGLPFYTGRIRYKINADIQLSDGEHAFIVLERFEAACINVVSAGKEDTVIPWRPYEADITEEIANNGEISLEAVLTRRNTFGPFIWFRPFRRGMGRKSSLPKEWNFQKLCADPIRIA